VQFLRDMSGKFPDDPQLRGNTAILALLISDSSASYFH
jgi:hypothetical protein